MIKLPARYCGLDTSTFITNRCTEGSTDYLLLRQPVRM